MESECVSCGACVQACPTATLIEKSVIEHGQPEHSVVTTCAYCGVGCSFKAEMQGERVVRMVPYKDGGANDGHSCVKGRFAWGYATHKDRITKPMIREKITDPWRDVSLGRGHQATPPTGSRRCRPSTAATPSAASPPRACTNEEVYLVQKHGARRLRQQQRRHLRPRLPLADRLRPEADVRRIRPARRTSSRVDKSDVIMVIGANPTDGHPVFASRMKRRLREGAKLIVVDPRRIDLVRIAARRGATTTCSCGPGTNVAVINALAHVIVTEGLVDAGFVAARCDTEDFARWETFIGEPEHSPEAMEPITGVPAAEVRAAARLYATGGNAAIYYGLGVTEHSQGSTMVMGMANLAMATGNIGREGVGVNPLRGQNNVQGSCDMGSFPHEFPGYRHVSRRGDAQAVREGVEGRAQSASPACASRTCSTQRSTAPSRACSCRARTSRSPIPTPTTSSTRSSRWRSSWCRTCSSTRRRRSRTCSSRAPRSWRRTAPSPTPSAASNRVRQVMRRRSGHARVGGRLPPRHAPWAIR